MEKLGECVDAHSSHNEDDGTMIAQATPAVLYSTSAAF
jgi:hypothetical protein